MSATKLNRRGFLGTAAAGAGIASMVASAPAAVVPGGKKPKFQLSIASYSLRKFDRATTIKMVKDLRVSNICIKSFHLPYEESPEQLAAHRKEFEDAGLKIVGGGTVSMQKEDEKDIRSYFEYAKHAGMPLMVIAPTAKTLPMIEKFVKEYNIAVAVHNHGTEDKHFPGPQDVLPIIKNMDPRVGLCVDLGHTVRTGIDVIEALKMSGSRILDIHMKDLSNLSDRESQVEVGRGAIPVAKVFHTLTEMGYSHCVGLEYEINADAPFQGMLESLSYERGILAALNL